MPEIKWAKADESVTSGEMLAWVRGMVRCATFLEIRAAAFGVDTAQSTILVQASKDIWQMVKADLGGIDA